MDNTTRDGASRPSTARRLSSDGPATAAHCDSTATLMKEQPISRPRSTSASSATRHILGNLTPLTPVHAPASTSPDKSSFMETPAPRELSDAQAKLAVREHLQEIESSFFAPLSPSNIPSLFPGIDDTYQFDSPSKKPVQLRRRARSTSPQHLDVSPRYHYPSFLSTPTSEQQKPASTPVLSPPVTESGSTAGNEAFSPFPASALRKLSSSYLSFSGPSPAAVAESQTASVKDSSETQHLDDESTHTSFLHPAASMGSMASGIDALDDSSAPPFEQPEALDDDGGLRTPKPSKTLAAPTDTVIARHVRDVQVPESLAEEYKSRGGLVTPARLTFATPTTISTNTINRNSRSLTLREQNTTIERLSKENFDLKLKVMFLSDRLDKLSEESIKSMISENVELKTGFAVLQRDNKVLRRRVKQLEKKLKDEEDRPGTAKSSPSDDEQSAAYDQEEIIYLREQLEEYAIEIDRLKQDNLDKEAEKRRMGDVVRALGEKAGERLGDGFERQEEADVWKDLLEQETARREQSDEDNRRLRDELFRLKHDFGSQTGSGPLHHTTNIYNYTKRSRDRPSSPSFSADQDGMTTPSQGTTLVDELRRESEQLRHENAELRREVGAQTSMLTSRNREKERLYQEIEDLKMAQRRGGPAPSTIDSILERSASRAGVHDRPHSRGSAITGATGTVLDDADRDELENKIAELRDKNNNLKLQHQDLQRELDACMADFESVVDAKTQTDELATALREDLDNALNDMMALQAERDEALQENANVEQRFESLRKEAQEEIDALESESDQRIAMIEQLRLDLNDRVDNFDALQGEMRKMSELLVRLEDDQEDKLRRTQQLEQELLEANKESEDLESKLLEANDKANRLSVQQESSQGEIAFLREEQEGDKIRIGDLEAALANAEQILRDEQDRARELEQRLSTERTQRDLVANREKQEVQQFVNDLNREASAAKDEARRLRKSLTSREVEATEWKERLVELENNLREALGDLNGTRSSLLKSIAKLQRDLENTVRDLDSTKSSLAEKDRIIKQRDALLESHALESRKMAEMLDKERQAHRNVKNQFETFQKTHQHVTRTVSSQDSRIMELESARAQDKKRLSQLENAFKEQLTERNNLLLVLWTRLSALCGTDWAHDNSLINGRALPSLEAVATMLPGFSKNLLAAVKTIETTVGSFGSQLKSLERDLWREYQTLENTLRARIKKLDHLEAIARNNIATGALGGPHSRSLAEIQARAAKIEDAYRQLKIENHTLRAAAEARASRYASGLEPNPLRASPVALAGSPSPLVPTGPRGSRIPKSGSTRGVTTPTRAASHSHPARDAGAESDDTVTTPTPTQPSGSTSAAASTAGGAMDNRYVLRFKDLENKLKAEREGRIMDRGEAMRRLDASEKEAAALRGDLEKEKRRAAQGASGRS